MQLEILKRDKLDYVFQSLSVISIVPMLFLETIKNWSVDQFSFTKSFYMGKQGMIVQILVIVLTFICYTLTRKLKIMDQLIPKHKTQKIHGKKNYIERNQLENL